MCLLLKQPILISESLKRNTKRKIGPAFAPVVQMGPAAKQQFFAVDHDSRRAVIECSAKTEVPHIVPAIMPPNKWQGLAHLLVLSRIAVDWPWRSPWCRKDISIELTSSSSWAAFLHWLAAAAIFLGQEAVARKSSKLGSALPAFLISLLVRCGRLRFKTVASSRDTRELR